MPRPPRKGNEDNPLRKLREALGTDQAPMFQHELAELLGLSPETVKSIEVGRLRVTEKLFDWLYVNLGASWSEKERAWFLSGSREPLTKEGVDRRRDTKVDRDMETDALCLRLLLLLDYAPNQKFKEIADTVEVKIQEILREFDYRPDNKDPDWINTTLHIRPDGSGGYIRYRTALAARKAEQFGGLFDFRYRLDFLTPRNRHRKQ